MLINFVVRVTILLLPHARLIVPHWGERSSNGVSVSTTGVPDLFELVPLSGRLLSTSSLQNGLATRSCVSVHVTMHFADAVML